MLALWALGSLLSGVITGAMQLRRPTPPGSAGGCSRSALLMLPLPFVDGFVALGVFLFLSGFAISPTLIASFAWIEETVPAGRLTEGITLFTTGLAAGLAPGRPSWVWSWTRTARPRATGSRWWPGCSAPSSRSSWAALSGTVTGDGHRPSDRLRERRPGRAHQQPLGHAGGRAAAARVAPTPASARPRQPPARRTAPGPAAGAAGRAAGTARSGGRRGCPRARAGSPRAAAAARPRCAAGR